MSEHPLHTYDPSDKEDIRPLTIGKWVLDINGDISYDGYYHIDHDRLSEEDWIIHLAQKDFLRFEEFMPNLFAGT
jgi:hypothetical protein